MGAYKYIQEAWKKPKENMPELFRERLIAWRKEPVCVRVERPTRLDRARALGYKAKTGYIIVRQRVTKGGRMHAKYRAARRPKAMGRKKIVGKSHQWIAEERAAKAHVGLQVLNSYWVAADGKHEWFEIILVDPRQPSIMKDKRINWICDPSNRGRVFRGKTSAGQKSRGMRNKGKGAEKIRPSLRANKGLAK
ncbi:50S ribosomal protein L15e [Candidatus Woesearchaeota archaeon]|nr:MAG: large subunit ribosomal protein L15e [archaeon GW2011_AR4]MBS3130757.1 50S ribosomal protein L15e [Candidatus Woesearchaeota archaeon]HIH38379.1 50S ribosomal protein L15e [Candidatus Woesearchaeota archaeon]HIJ03071.1 50S ribosomal protein L15e [Candidatus Woesearchaeota archaeon]